HTPAHPCAPLTHTLAYLTGPQPPTPPLFPYTTLFRSNEPTGAHLQPILVALEDAEILPDAAEAVDIEVPELCPVDELDAELEGALGSCEKLVLVELERGVVVLDGRDGRLADTDRGDLVRLDEADAYGALQELREERRSHPARSSAPHNDDILDALIHRSAPPGPRILPKQHVAQRIRLERARI